MNKTVVPFRVGERLLMMSVVSLILILAMIVVQVAKTILSGVRPEAAEVGTLMAFIMLMMSAVAIMLPLARRFDIRHGARLDLYATSGRVAAARIGRGMRMIRLPFHRR